MPNALPLEPGAQQAWLDNETLKQHAARNVLAMLGIGAVTGLAGRSLLGRRYLFGRPDPGTPAQLGEGRLPPVVPLPYPVRDDERRRPVFPKLARTGPELPPGPLQLPGLRGLRRGYSPELAGRPGYDDAGLQLPSTLRGDYATSPHGLDIPWHPPAAAAAGAAGLVGGWGLADWWINRKRKQDLDEEVNRARTEYEQALLTQYPAGGVKRAGAATPGERLGLAADRLADLVVGALEKRAELTGTAAGLAATLAMLLAGGGAYAGYHWSKDRSEAGLLEEAYKRRQREQFRTRPPEMTAVPVPVHVGRDERLHPVGELPTSGMGIV